MNGVMASVTSVPAQFKISTILFHGSDGVNNAMTAWGGKLLRMYNKADGRKDDMRVHTLGYNTDHGAYYYYRTEPHKNYAQTLIDVQASAKQVNIPYQWVLLDSWWYFKGKGGGVANWTVRPNVFPPGGDAALSKFHQDTKWPIVGHNRYWSSDSPYAKQNGGDFEFSHYSDPKNYIVPLEQRFWDWLLTKSKAWGLAVYEQDWMYNEFEGVPILTQNATMARMWLMQMGEAARKNDLTVQYCMAWPRHALQSVEIPAVTQIRASDDYVPGHRGTSPNWNIGGSSIFAHALFLAPFKDNYWTNSSEPPVNATEPAVWLHSAVSSLSAGPVTPSDGIGFSNVELILRSCRSDGILLQPSRPATYMDAFISGTAKGTWTASGHVWSSYTIIPVGGRWDIVFSHKLSSPYEVTPKVLTLDRQQGEGKNMKQVAYSLETKSLSIKTLQVQLFDNSMPFKTAPTADKDNGFEIWHIAPIAKNGWALLGELAKWVPVSESRVASVTDEKNQLRVDVVGSKGEEIILYFADSTSIDTSRNYTVNPNMYCDDRGKHVHVYTSDTDSLDECRAVCDMMPDCSCFDFKKKSSNDELFQCRVSNDAVVLTKSATGYTAYEPIVPPPPHLKIQSIKCVIGVNGKAVARIPTGTCE